jgi:hypothetical protein
MTARPLLPMTAVIQRYLALKQALGFRYDGERDVLRHLESFLRSQRGARDLTPVRLTPRRPPRVSHVVLERARWTRRQKFRLARSFSGGANSRKDPA